LGAASTLVARALEPVWAFKREYLAPAEKRTTVSQSYILCSFITPTELITFFNVRHAILVTKQHQQQLQLNAATPFVKQVALFQNVAESSDL
jgi:hypothetical protein